MTWNCPHCGRELDDDLYECISDECPGYNRFFGGFKVGDVETGSLEYFYLTTPHHEENFLAEGAIGWRADSTVMVEGFCEVWK